MGKQFPRAEIELVDEEPIDTLILLLVWSLSDLPEMINHHEIKKQSQVRSQRLLRSMRHKARKYPKRSHRLLRSVWHRTAPRTRNRAKRTRKGFYAQCGTRQENTQSAHTGFYAQCGTGQPPEPKTQPQRLLRSLWNRTDIIIIANAPCGTGLIGPNKASYQPLHSMKNMRPRLPMYSG